MCIDCMSMMEGVIWPDGRTTIRGSSRLHGRCVFMPHLTQPSPSSCWHAAVSLVKTTSLVRVPAGCSRYGAGSCCWRPQIAGGVDFHSSIVWLSSQLVLDWYC